MFKRRPHTLPELREQIIEEVNAISPYPAICVNELYKTSEIVSNSVLLLTAAILRTLFSKLNDYKWDILLNSKIKTFFLYLPPLLFYNSSKLLNRFCRTLYNISKFGICVLYARNFRFFFSFSSSSHMMLATTISSSSELYSIFIPLLTYVSIATNCRRAPGCDGTMCAGSSVAGRRRDVP